MDNEMALHKELWETSFKMDSYGLFSFHGVRVWKPTGFKTEWRAV